jgi:tetratricopeptide (TPR) repeat protein
MDKFEEVLSKLKDLYKRTKEFHGQNNERYENACKELSDKCNLLAVNFLREERYEETLSLLNRCKDINIELIDNEQQLAMTYNNLACYYRKVGHLRNALTYLESALELELQLRQEEAP